MYRLFNNNKVAITIIIFVGLYATIQYFKPSFLYKPTGELRQFGLGYKNKTVFPAWLLSIVLAILVYVIVCYYIMNLAR